MEEESEEFLCVEVAVLVGIAQFEERTSSFGGFSFLCAATVEGEKFVFAYTQ